MKKVCFVTATRAEYGLLRPIMLKIINEKSIELQIIATGMHLSPEFGSTYHDIENDGFNINEKVEIQMSSDTPIAISKTMGLAMISFSEVLTRLAPDLLVLLGDRYETFAIASSAVVLNIPIVHLYGGETTEGAIDEAFRHAITKMSYLHFTSTEQYRKRVIQLGESPNRVYNVGAIGVENIKTIDLLEQDELEKQIDFHLGKRSAVVTFHPVTLETSTAEEQFNTLLSVLDSDKDLNLIFTKANSDTDGRIINQMIDKYVANNVSRAIAFTSLGTLRYLSTLKYVDLVIGNSSSGIIEAPSFHVPTINIGDRQKGRIHGESVIDCIAEKISLERAIDKGLSKNFYEQIKQAQNPYEKKNTSSNIISIMKNFLLNEKIDLKKSFYDIRGY